MELVSKISKGTRMDQVYIPKNRRGFYVGEYVIIKPLEIERVIEKPFFYNIKHIEPIKIDIIMEILNVISKTVDNYENIIITGSFLDGGFNFSDIDIIIVSEEKLNIIQIKKSIEDMIRIKIHLIILNNKTLMDGLSKDPLYQMMLSKCITKKRFIYRIDHKIDYRILDLHLLKSKLLIDNFDYLNGIEKYYLTRNMIAISLYIKHKKINKEIVDKETERLFNIKNIQEIKQNMLNKNKFLKLYKKIYSGVFNKIMGNIKRDTKQKKLIDLFIGNISNSIIHKILEKAIDNEEIINKYIKEYNISLEIAKRYRKKINPIKTILPNKDVVYIRNKIVNKVKAELMLRISKGYKNINLDLVEEIVDKTLKEVNII